MVVLGYNPIANLPDWSDSSGTYPADKIRDKIFRYAGREATFAYQIATCGEEAKKPYIQENAFYEPFTYWDWQEKDLSNKWVTTNAQADNKRKRRLFWERGRGFRVNGGKWESYPSPKKRWEDFKSRVDDGNRGFVKNIAMAGWMTTNDFDWITRELPQLEALDLSNLTSISENTLKVLNPLLKRLKWLGLANVTAYKSSGIAASAILPLCTQLEALSLRTSYSDADPFIYLLRDDKSFQSLPAGLIHKGLCQLLLIIEHHVPFTVKTLELRQPVACMHFFLKQLDALRAQRKIQIDRVGIDLGAWIQMYPLQSQPSRPAVGTSQLANSESIRYRVEQAVERTIKTAQTLEETQLASGLQVTLPPKTGYKELKAEKQEESATQDENISPPNFRDSRYDYYVNRSGTFIDQKWSSPKYDQSLQAEHNCALDADPMHKSSKATIGDRKANTLLRMLYSLWEAHLMAKKRITLFCLDPEPEERSCDPIHPFGLIQTTDEGGIGTGATFRAVDPDTDLTYLYSWLNTTFQWRPVFDWDCFMVPEDMNKSIDHSYKSILTEVPNYMELIKRQFILLRQAGIPLHLIIGRRNPNQSSCYWGWPYQKEKWEDWLLQKFDANLDNIANILDSLSIFYDLRNPIDQRRLEDIEAIDPCRNPNAYCPKDPCPWKHDKHYDGCPFLRHRTPLDQPVESNDGQKMAIKRWLNKMSRIPTSHSRLANAYGTVPPVGENANDHASDDSDSDDSPDISAKIPLHHLSRRAAFAREAVGWQRFWSTYSLKFTNLTVLRVRMPRHFDQIDSWRLAKLLDQKKGWRMLMYTDERQHLQTEEDLTGYVGRGRGKNPAFEHLPEAKTWPAGRFVRRSWIWSEQDAVAEGDVIESTEQIDEKITFPLHSGNAWRGFEAEDWDSTEAQEDNALQTARKWAEDATQKEREAQEALSVNNDGQKQAEEGPPAKDLHIHAIRKYAQQEWENILQYRIDQFDQELERVVASLKQPSTSNDEAAKLQQQGRVLNARITWLQARMVEDVPILIQSEGASTWGGTFNHGLGTEARPQGPSGYADGVATAKTTAHDNLQQSFLLPGIPPKLPGLGSLDLPYPTQSPAKAPSKPQPDPAKFQMSTGYSPENLAHLSLTQDVSNPKLTTGEKLIEPPPKKRKAAPAESAAEYPKPTSLTLANPNAGLNAGTEPIEALAKKRKASSPELYQQETKQSQPTKSCMAREATTRGTEPSSCTRSSPTPDTPKETLSKKTQKKQNHKPNLDVIDEEPDDDQSNNDTDLKNKGKGKASMKKRHSRQEYRPKGGKKTEIVSPVARRTRSRNARGK